MLAGEGAWGAADVPRATARRAGGFRTWRDFVLVAVACADERGGVGGGGVARAAAGTRVAGVAIGRAATFSDA